MIWSGDPRAAQVAREANRVHRLMLVLFGPDLYPLFGYDKPHWRRPADVGRLAEVVARAESQAWERTLAQRIANERLAGAMNDYQAAGLVAEELVKGWVALIRAERRHAPRVAAAGRRLDAHMKAGNHVVAQLQKAIHEVTRRWRTLGETGPEGLSVPVIRGRVRDDAAMKALLEVARSAARLPVTDGRQEKTKSK